MRRTLLLSVIYWMSLATFSLGYGFTMKTVLFYMMTLFTGYWLGRTSPAKLT